MINIINRNLYNIVFEDYSRYVLSAIWIIHRVYRKLDWPTTRSWNLFSSNEKTQWIISRAQKTTEEGERQLQGNLSERKIFWWLIFSGG